MDTISKEHRSWNMSRIKSKNTRPEMTVRSTLHKMGFRFRLHNNKMPGKPDIVLPRYKTVIFVHGCFWHRHSNCKYAYNPKSKTDFWRNKFKETVRRDKDKELTLKSSGWKVLTIWECEIKNTENIEDKIKRLIKR
ncbi:MAG: DNA mismatch endonuclease Vsr [bacterium]|nr:DNA mismatch endonuclease Vsr [bacterium]